jgi:16S rRNA (cytidine1402-2'-O)-methyltransferase
MTGNIYLIPVTLGGDDFLKVIPCKVIEQTRQLRYFIVENTRSARRFLRHIDNNFPIDETVFYELNEHTGDKEIDDYIKPAFNGHDIGVMSEAGLPGIADPGARIVALAHRKNIRVVPFSGPSSIILALISSGLNGQNFTFNGYLPVKHDLRSSKLKEIEKRAKTGFSQIFIETPYRAKKMFESIIATCEGNTQLCIATDVTLDSESIKTKTISQWKNTPPAIEDKLVIFIIQ